MGSLIIRDLDDDVKQRLRTRAAEHGRSMEAEARVILAASVGAGRPVRNLGTHLRQQFADVDAADFEVPSRIGTAGTVDFDT